MRGNGGIIGPKKVVTISSATGIWRLSEASSYKNKGEWPTMATPPGQVAYTTPGTYSWVAPVGVTSVSAVCVGAAGRGIGLWYGNVQYYNSASSSGAGLGWKNNIAVTPGDSYTVVVGGANQESYFINSSTVRGGQGGWGSAGGTFTGDGGGNGGWYAGGENTGGGGAGGYTGGGGQANSSNFAGTGGAGAGGSTGTGCGGGGVGILGQGASGTTSGQGGSGGSNGTVYNGGVYGGGAGCGPNPPSGPSNSTIDYGTGGSGAVRIIWGTGRSFPSTNTGNV